MSALQWSRSGPDSRVADGRYSKWWYELHREHTNAGTWWTAWFYVGSEERPQRLAQGSFTEVRHKAIAHHNHPGYP